MPGADEPLYRRLPDGRFDASAMTRGPWHPEHQHGGPPTALLGGALERLAGTLDLPQIARLTVNLLRPVPIAPLELTVAAEQTGRRAAHLTGTIRAGGREVMRATALAIRAAAVPLPETGPHRDEPVLTPGPDDAPPFEFPFFSGDRGYHRALDGRLAHGRFGQGPAAIWFRLRVPVVHGEAPTPLQRVLVAADSGNGISIVLDISRYTFVNPDLTVHLHRAPRGEWVALDARTMVGPLGAGLATARLFDSHGQIGHGLQSLVIESR